MDTMTSKGIYTDMLPPHDLDAEESVLGSCIIDPEAMYYVAKILKPGDFYREKNAWTYEACLRAYNVNPLDIDHMPVNQITVAYELKKRTWVDYNGAFGKRGATLTHLDIVGGAAYISHLVSMVPTTVAIKYYTQIVKDCADRRQQIKKAEQLKKDAYLGVKPKRTERIPLY